MSRLEQHASAAVEHLARRAAQAFNEQVAPLTIARPAPAVLPTVDEPAYQNQAYYAARLAMRRSWVTRRNETFTFVDADTVRRRMSVDFTMPPSSTLAAGDMALVPLMLLAKRDLRNLDVRNDAGDALPVLSTAQNGIAAALGVAGVLERLVDHLPAAHPDRLVDLDALNEIVFALPPYRAFAAHHVEAGGSLDRQLQYAQQGTRAQIEGLVHELERYFMLLVPLEYWPGQRHVCKLSYDAAIKTQHASRGARLYTGLNRTMSSFGLAGRFEVFDNLAVGLGLSYHAEAVPPRDTYIAEAALTVHRPGEPTGDAPITDKHSFRPHLRATPTKRGDEGSLSLIIHAHRGELLLPLAFSSLLISVALGFLPSHVYDVDGQTLGALLLVPFALSAFYIRSQENSYVTSMLRGVRLLALLPLLAAVWAIGLIALGTIPPNDGAALASGILTEIRVPFLVAAVPSVVLLLATVSSALGRVTRPVIRAQQERSRQATRERLAQAERENREPARGHIQAAARVFAGALAILLIAGVLSYSGWRAASTWWEQAVPSAPHRILQTR